MDRKTLEYMEERAGRARIIVKRIDTLQDHLERIDEIREVDFENQNGHVLFDISTRHQRLDTFSHRRLMDDLREHLKESISKEIARLESELAKI